MTRSIAVVVLALCACSDPTVEPMADAAIDGVPSADAGDAVDGPPGELDGDWSVTWTCVEVCTPEPELLRTQELLIDSGSLHWHSATCSDCIVDHAGAMRDGCIDVPAGRDNDLDDRGAYSICSTSPSALSAEIVVRRVGGLPQAPRWRVDGVRR